MEWISVKDKLPEKSGRYLVFDKCKSGIHNCLAWNWAYPCCEVNIAYFTGGQFSSWSWATDINLECVPQYWMPLPEVPC